MRMLPGAAAAIFSATCGLIVLVDFIEPVFDQRHIAAEDFAESIGDFVERADGFVGLFAAEVAEDDLLPAAGLPNWSVAFIERRRMSSWPIVGPACNRHRRG